MTLNTLFEEVGKIFPDWQQQQRDVEDLITYRTGLTWSDLQIRKTADVDCEAAEQILENIAELVQGKPSAYILGFKHFYKHRFHVDHRALIPRPETEILVEKALQIKPQPQKIIDLGTGSGCIGLSLAKEWPTSHCVLIDASAEALALCRENQRLLGVKNVETHCIEVTIEEPRQFDLFELVVANPPYIAVNDSRVATSVHDYEPHQALYSKNHGLECISNWMQWAERHLNHGGHYIFEFGQNQECEIEKVIKTTRFTIVDLINDYQNTPRFFHLQK